MAGDGVDGRRSGAVPKPTVLYIAGSGRSGSTLLERLLGTVPGIVNIGELNDLFRRVMPFDERCGCGEPFSQCPFWLGVGRRAFGGWDPDLATEVETLHAEVARQRDVARLVAPRGGQTLFEKSLARYALIHRKIYAAAAEESGAGVVVDASKGAAQVLAVSRTGEIDLRLLHLVRDARGVAFSWAKGGVARPHGADSEMHRFSPGSTALRWTVLQGQIALARRFATAATLVRYEDLVAAPAAEVVKALSGLGLGEPDASLDSASGCQVDLPASHGLSGNPSRFRTGPQTLRPDEQWRTDMPLRDRLVTTAIAAGPLVRHGYLGRGNGSSR